MCSRGIYQLQRVFVQFCDWGGSSKGIRELLSSDSLQHFMKENPQIEFEFYTRRNKHPYISSSYINGYVKDFPILNLNSEEIMDALQRVRNQSGRKPLPHKGKRVYSSNKSIQGEWTENLWNNYPVVELEKIRGPKKPDITYELVDKETNQSSFVYHKDFVNAMINAKTKKYKKGEQF